MAIKRVHAVIYGKVQGIYFRAYAQAEGTKIGVKGWVRNRTDGTVEAVVEGEEAQVEQMVEWLKKGSPGAQILKVETKEERPVGEAQFNIRY